MKRKYFLTTAGTFLGIFLVLILFEAVFTTIFEISPVWKMAIVIAVLIFDIKMTDHLVNKDFEKRWLRPVPEVKVVEIKKKQVPARKEKMEEGQKKEASEEEEKEDTKLVKLENLVDQTIANEQK